MIRRIALRLGLLLCIAALILGGMIAFGTAERPPEMHSVVDVASNIDYHDLPSLSYFVARDGTRLAYRAYSAAGKSVAVLVHGTSGSSMNMHALAKALRNKGTTSFALDIRGHGGSGPHGDIKYIGQLEDDLADFVRHIRRTYPSAPLALVAHSSGAGFAIRIHGSDIGSLFSHYVLLSPFLGYNAPTVRPAAGGWTAVSLPRIIALTILQRFHITLGSGLPVIQFAVPKRLDGLLTASYSFRLLQNFGPPVDYIGALARTQLPVTVLVGQRDEIMYADRFADALKVVKDHVTVTVLPSVGHMSIVSDPLALESVIKSCVTGIAPEGPQLSSSTT